MKKIRLFSVLSAVLVLASCSTASSKEVVRSVYTLPNEMRLNHYAISLFKGEKESVKASFLPSQAAGTEVTYTTSDASIATVDKNGVVTAKSDGEAVITASCPSSQVDKDGKTIMLTKEVVVTVTHKATYDELVSAVDYQATKQALLNVTQYENKAIHYSYTLQGNEETKNPTRLRGYVDDCITTVSKTEGFLQIDGYQIDTKTEGGSDEPSPYMWTFYCDSNYDSWLFHKTGAVLNYTSIPTQAYLGQARIKPVYDIGNSLFGNLIDIVDRGFDDALEADFIDDIKKGTMSDSSISNIGIGNNNIVRFTYSGPIRGIISADEESKLNIPANTSYTGQISYDLTYVDGVVKTNNMTQVMYYNNQFDGLDYIWDVYYEDYYLVNEKATLNYPNISDYRRVDTAFDL